MGNDAMTVGRVVLPNGEQTLPSLAAMAAGRPSYTVPALSDADLERITDRLAEKIDRRMLAVKPRLMDIETAAMYLGRSKRAVEHLIAKRLIPTTKIDNKAQIDRVALDKLIVEKTAW